MRQHPEHDRLYLEDTITSHHISKSALDILLDTCLQNMPSGPPTAALSIDQDMRHACVTAGCLRPFQKNRHLPVSTVLWSFREPYLTHIYTSQFDVHHLPAA